MFRDMATTKSNLPAVQQVSPLLLPGKHHVTQMRDECDEEFDFSDVFGPAPPHPIPQLPTVAENGETDGWCPELRQDPVVVYSRSHSLVGPSPKPGLTRLQGKPIWDEPDSAPATGTASVPTTAEGVNELASQATGLTLSDSGDSGSEREGDDQVRKEFEDGNGLEKLGPQDFELLRVVGQGSFGKVFQVRKKGTSEIYAMKVMRKQNILKRNHGSYVKAERDILTKVVHPFIVQLQYSFQVCNSSQNHNLGVTVLVVNFVLQHKGKWF